MPDSGRCVVADASVLEAIRGAAQAAVPNEACGLLLGHTDKDTVIVRACVPGANVAPDPVRRFEVDPAVRFRVEREARTGGLPMIGLYHSHPASSAEPSETDRSSILEPGLLWLIAGPHPEWEVRAWRAGQGEFRELALSVSRG